MLLTLTKFQALSRAVQIGTALMEGTHLATRYEGEDLITLYYLGSFFVEVYYDPESNQLHRCRCFTSPDALADYLPYVKLTDLA